MKLQRLRVICYLAIGVVGFTVFGLRGVIVAETQPYRIQEFIGGTIFKKCSFDRRTDLESDPAILQLFDQDLVRGRRPGNDCGEDRAEPEAADTITCALSGAAVG